MSLHLQAVAKRYGGNTVFEDLNLAVGSSQKVALIGANGSGKSTLLRLIAGLEQPDSGTISVQGTVSLLEQRPELGDEPVVEALMPAALRSASDDLNAAQEALADPSDANLRRFATAEERYRVLGGYDFGARAEAMLAGLELDGEVDVARLSGGQQRRVLLARQLLAPGDVLLLDEPTNHLDTTGLVWLEGWLRSSPATVLVVSHDRAFLNTTVTSVAELERGELAVWPGNYTEAMAVKATEKAAQQRMHDAQAREKRKLEVEAGRLASAGRSAASFNHRRAGNQALILSKAKAENVSRTLASRARAMQKRLDRFEVTPEPFDDHDVPEVPLPEVPLGPSEVVRLEHVTLERGGRTLLRDLSFTLRRGEKLALLGPNGSGKSSLLQLVLGRLAPDSGRVLLGSGLEPFHAGQQGDELRDFETLEDAVRAAQPTLRRQDLYYLLARLGLPPEPTFPVPNLSGGQRTRLALARLAVTRAPLLVLDEPNNQLDVRMVEALETLLEAYPGTLLFASHDRRLVTAVASRTLTLRNDGHQFSDGLGMPAIDPRGTK